MPDVSGAAASATGDGRSAGVRRLDAAPTIRAQRFALRVAYVGVRSRATASTAPIAVWAVARSQRCFSRAARPG